MDAFSSRFTAAIACGGTGGHLFPGLAVAEALQEFGGDSTLILSEKESDKETGDKIRDSRVISLPAVSFQRGKFAALNALWKSYRQIKAEFQARRPSFVLGMGGFASAAPLMAARSLRIPSFLHDSNAIPGRVNRWLAPWVDGAFIGFEKAAERLRRTSVAVTGTPVRRQFEETEQTGSRTLVGLDADRPVLLVMGGSQGASAINRLSVEAAPALLRNRPELQILHITGKSEFDSIKEKYAALGAKARVFPFLTEMELALSAATIGVSRAGASSLAELATVGLPCILIPYPTAADNHQWFNASEYARSGAAWMIEQEVLTAGKLAESLLKLLNDSAEQARLRAGLKAWQRPDAAHRIAETMLQISGIPISRPFDERLRHA